MKRKVTFTVIQLILNIIFVVVSFVYYSVVHHYLTEMDIMSMVALPHTYLILAVTSYLAVLGCYLYTGSATFLITTVSMAFLAINAYMLEQNQSSERDYFSKGFSSRTAAASNYLWEYASKLSVALVLLSITNLIALFFILKFKKSYNDRLRERAQN